eukprot:CAMPEP_0205934860 /NCGR_PEP_ID=MMETSP1325-20131115/37653_1 /ASSEMBLY_ACC=CAM_ASM_000708 /TAXON_ID=236786 /ORGANISM="Florenciella sp., Strain RCC1007" /LENGTH=38 /DNA_ID= /DNA_START= /DNA_END= /DNA_ORIENTATION=
MFQQLLSWLMTPPAIAAVAVAMAVAMAVVAAQGDRASA